MWDRLFGRGKQEEAAEPTCANCGRTLLPGEWAQTVVRDDGTEEIVCSLCSQSAAYPEHQPAQPQEQGQYAVGPEAPAAAPAGEAAQPGFAAGTAAYGAAAAADDESAQTAPHETPAQFFDAQAAEPYGVAPESGASPAADEAGSYAAPEAAQPYDAADAAHGHAAEAPVYDDSQAIPSAADYGAPLDDQTAELPATGEPQPAEHTAGGPEPVDYATGGPWASEPTGGEPSPEVAAVAGATIGAGVGAAAGDDSEAFWQALRDKDAEIARLQAEVLRLEAERRELAGQVSRTQGVDEGAPETQQFVAEPPAPGGQEALATAAAVSTAEAADAHVAQPDEQTVAPGLDAEGPADHAAEWAPNVAEPQAPAPDEGPPLIPADEWSQTQYPEAEETAAFAAAPTEAPGVETPTPDDEQPTTVDAPHAAEPGTQAAPETLAPVAHATEPIATAMAAEPVGGEPVAEPVGGEPVAEPVEGEPVAEPVGDAAMAAGVAAAAQHPVDTPTEPLEAVDVPEQAPIQAELAQGAGEEEWCPVCDTADLPGAAVTAGPATVPEETGTVQMDTVGDVVGHELVFETDEEPEDLHRLQRAADLFNVSDVPEKVAETNDLLGAPAVHLSSEEDGVKALLLWSMAWYEYSVDLDSGDVTLLERGYDERSDLRPNASARPDGTIQPTPIPTRRPIVKPAEPAAAGVAAAAPVAHTPPEAPSETAGDAPAPAPDESEPEEAAQRPADAGKGDIISKSLKGKRTDDETVAWDEMAARDFDWGQ